MVLVLITIEVDDGSETNTLYMSPITVITQSL